MRIQVFTRWLVAVLLIVSMGIAPSVHAQAATDDKVFKTEELDQMLAPIALYPDELLSNVLVASTYPLEVVQAARWIKEPQNAKLKGDALTKALEDKDWDPSVKSLTLTPDVLQTMSEKLDWTQKLGDAFLAQQDEVMDRIQFLRQKAEDAGSLKSNKQQKVTKEKEYIVIEPAAPDVVYVPVYQPTVVYGSWWYPSYPPYYWYWGRPASAFVSGFFWGTGFAVANSLWGWGRFDWRRHDIHIDINRYNNINVNRTKITSNTWKHDPKHRGPVPYRDKKTRDAYGKAGRVKDARKDFRGFDETKLKDKAGKVDRDAVRDKLGDKSGAKLKDKAGKVDRDQVKDKLGDKGGAKLKDKSAKIDRDKVQNKLGDKKAPKIKDKAKAKDRPRPSGGAKLDKSKINKKASRKSAGGLDVKSKKHVNKSVNRGSASRKKASAHRGGGGLKKGGGKRRR